MCISMIDEDCVERIYKDAEDLFVSMKLRKRKKRSLDEVIAEIGAHVVSDSDATEIVREMRKDGEVRSKYCSQTFHEPL